MRCGSIASQDYSQRYRRSIVQTTQAACRERLNWSSDCFHVIFPTNHGDPCKRPELARAAVEDLKKLGISIEIHGLRNVPHNNIPIWLNAADVLLLTALHGGSPNIVKEVFACNVPVVSVDVGDVRERIQGINGRYLALSDPGVAAKLCLVHDTLPLEAAQAMVSPEDYGLCRAEGEI